MVTAQDVGGQRVIGGYDGVDVWTLRSWSLESVHQHVFASLHERLHHELQSTTLWGLITRFADDFMRRPEYRTSARLLFWVGVMRSQLVHETYATTLAAGLESDYVALLAANPDYLAHHRRGLDLLDSTAESWPRDRFVIDGGLRGCMSAPGLVALAAQMPSIRVADLDRPELQPDHRLGGLQSIDLTPLREAATDPPSSVASLRAFHDRCADHLTENGLPTASSEQEREAVHLLVERARELLGLDITIDEERDDPVADDAELLQRERIELHDQRLPARVMDLRAAAADPALFTRDHPKLGNHVLVVWVRPDVLARQLTDFEAGSDYFLGLQAAGVDETGRPIARLARCDETTDPSELAAAFTSVTPLILTTLSSLTDAPASATFSGDQELYVLVDLPVIEALRLSCERGAPVTWARLQVGGDQELKGVVWEAAGLRGVIHLHLASEAGHLALVRWLAAQPAHLAVSDQSLLTSHQAQLDAIVQHIFASWQVLERRDRSS